MRDFGKNGEVPNYRHLVKIYCFFLSNLMWKEGSGDLLGAMRGSFRMVFGLVLLIATATTFSCRIVGRRSFDLLPSESYLKRMVPVFNATLIEFAGVDIGEAKTKQEIEQLLEGNFGGHRSISFWMREKHHEVSRMRTSRRVNGVPLYYHSPKYHKHWFEFRRVLRDWFRNKRFQVDIMLQLNNLVKRPLDRHYGIPEENRLYSSCAVVGNSGILLKNEYGNLIDSHEFVIRLNNARIKGYQSNVGSKTSISFVNSNILHLCSRREGCFCHPYGVTVPMVMYICQAIHFMDYTICNFSHRAPLLVTDARFDVLCARIVKYYSLKQFVEETGKPPEQWASAHDGSLFHYSSGMQAVMLALGVCDRVSIFGFGKSTEAKHHYHTNQKAELHLHDYAAEYAFYQDLVEKPQA